MGTRHLIQVKLNNEIKIAQYGQWDGYPTGQGSTIAKFLKTANLEKFKESLKNVKFDSDENLDKKYAEFSDDGWLNMEQAKLYKAKYPELSRDTGADILQLVYDNRATELADNSEFKKDELFCEYAYLIDLDKQEIEISGRINKTIPFLEFTEEKMEQLENE